MFRLYRYFCGAKIMSALKKDLYGCIAVFVVVLGCGYLIIEWHHDAAVTFEKLCSERPALKDCPKPEKGKAL